LLAASLLAANWQFETNNALHDHSIWLPSTNHEATLEDDLDAAADDLAEQELLWEMAGGAPAEATDSDLEPEPPKKRRKKFHKLPKTSQDILRKKIVNAQRAALKISEAKDSVSLSHSSNIKITFV